MKTLLAIALSAFLGLSSLAYGQSSSPVLLPGGCGTGNFPNGSPASLTVDSTGKLCDSGGAVVSFPSGFTTTTGALQPPTAASGKITVTRTSVTATTSITIAAANANRIALDIQCDGTAAVNVSETGAVLNGTDLEGTVTIPAGSFPFFTPPIATLTAITAYTGTTQNCRVVEYNR